eukprot:COSAG01_NODE_21082_length_919_cov_0.840244_1_plen_231_part_10
MHRTLCPLIVDAARHFKLPVEDDARARAVADFDAVERADVAFARQLLSMRRFPFRDTDCEAVLPACASALSDKAQTKLSALQEAVEPDAGRAAPASREQAVVAQPAVPVVLLGTLQARFEAAHRRFQTGDDAGALVGYKSCLATARSLGHRQAEGAVLGNLGNAYHSLGQYQRAMEHHTQGLAISREIGNRRGEGSDLGNLGNAYFDLGQYQRAIEHYTQALAISREIGDR